MNSSTPNTTQPPAKQPHHPPHPPDSDPQSARREDVTDLYRRFNPKLVRLVASRFRVDPEVAREAAQFAWLKLWEKQPSHDNIEGWLYTVAKFELFAIARRTNREPPAEIYPHDHVDDTDLADRLERDLLKRTLATAMAAQLTDHQRAALQLWSQGWKYKEIAAELGKTYTWVNRHITEGIAALRSAMNP